MTRKDKFGGRTVGGDVSDEGGLVLVDEFLSKRGYGGEFFFQF